MRKRALVEESEMYRQLLALHIQNAQIYRAEAQRKFQFITKWNKILLIGLPVAVRLLFRRASKPKRGSSLKRAGAALIGTQLLKRFGPLVLRMILKRYAARRRAIAEDMEMAH
jgi:hypothetical protein